MGNHRYKDKNQHKLSLHVVCARPRPGQARENLLRRVFTSDRVGVGVIIRSVERYDLVKIKHRNRKQSFQLIALTLPSLTIK